MISKKSVVSVLDHNKSILHDLYKSIVFNKKQLERLSNNFSIDALMIKSRITVIESQIIVYKNIIEDLESIINE